MKFKVGDRVRVKSIDWYEKNKEKDGTIPVTKGIGFSQEMKCCCGQIFTITIKEVLSKTLEFYKVEENTWNWCDWMLEDKIVDEVSEKWRDCIILQGYYSYEEALQTQSSGVYRLPTKEEFDELIERTSYSLNEETKEGMFTFTDGYALKLPAAGYNDKGICFQGFNGYYWSSSTSSGNIRAYGMRFNSTMLNSYVYSFHYRFSVVLIREKDFKKEISKTKIEDITNLVGDMVFPVKIDLKDKDCFRNKGLSKREYMATQLLSGLLSSENSKTNAVETAVLMADQLIEELKKKVKTEIPTFQSKG